MANKRVLLVCKEAQSWPMHYLGKRLRKEGKNVAAYFFMPHESMQDHPDYNKFTDLNRDIRIYTTEELGNKYLERAKKDDISADREYIKEIENKYTNNNNIHQQLLSSQFTSRYYHYRDYYKSIPLEKRLFYLQLFYQRTEEILGDFQPDVIYDVNTAELGRTVLYEVATEQNIPYITVRRARFRKYRLPTLNFNMGPERWFVKKFNNSVNKFKDNPKSLSSHIVKKIREFRAEDEILAEDYKKTHEDAYLELGKDTFHMFRRVFYSIRQILPRWWWYERHVTTPLFSEPLPRLLDHVNRYFRKLMTTRGDYFCEVELSETNYILMPLHLIPESSTFVKAPFFIDEKFIIESLAKSVKPYQKILVKEHHSMIGERPLSFYKKISQLPNVILVNPFQFSDPKPYIENAQAVVTITGTTGFEASMFKKPVITFGSPIYSVLSNVADIRDVTRMPEIIENWDNNNYETSLTDKELAAYLKTVFEWGEAVDYKVLGPPQKESPGTDYKDVIESLVNLFGKGEKLTS